ncbi:LysR family transcriptional regulator [Sphingomonas profundi]|uniref:LysR family transcriptional regulator n=1 Tax=Alterirhizorhabdus profundi TaxID=2681549 RepID=UPI0012E8DE8D|nr:LysR family transcriptional regulator [Sphingomonas profundi]
MTRSEGSVYKSMIDNLSALRAFVAVVESGSFSEAGYRLNVVPSTISKHVSTLEERISGQLLLRSTKHFSVTELGRRFYEMALTILHEVEAAEQELGAYQAEPQGKLRVTVPPAFASFHLAGLLEPFLARYPRITLELRITTEVLDLIDKSVDVAIRISGSLDPSLVAVKLAPNYRRIVASPDYLAKHGTPATPEDLAQHNCLLVSETASAAKWPIRSGDGVGYVAVSGNLIVTHGEMYRRAILAGIGIGYAAAYLVHDKIQTGELVELFPDRKPVLSHIWAVYIERRNLPLKTRAFIDHIRQAFREPPAWARE